MKQKRHQEHPLDNYPFEEISPNDQLPHEILTDFNMRKIYIVVAGMVVTVAIFNFLIIGFLGRYSTNFGYFLSYQKWQILKHLDEPVDWLILGDSSVNQGLIPSMIETDLGGKALNLGTNGEMITLDDLWMLEYYIQRFGPPENIIIVHVYDIWFRDFNPVLLGQIPLPWGFWKNFSATETLVWNREIQRDVFLERYVPIYSQNKSLGKIIQDTFLSFRNPFRNDWLLNADGYLPAHDPKPEIVVADADDHIEFATEINFDLSDLNQKALSEIKRIADEYGINVYILFGPQYEGLYSDQDFREYLHSVINELSEYAAQSENIEFISRVKTFPAEMMQNTDHLIEQGAVVYTKWLVDQIKLLH